MSETTQALVTGPSAFGSTERKLTESIAQYQAVTGGFKVPTESGFFGASWNINHESLVGVHHARVVTVSDRIRVQPDEFQFRATVE